MCFKITNVGLQPTHISLCRKYVYLFEQSACVNYIDIGRKQSITINFCNSLLLLFFKIFHSIEILLMLLQFYFQNE